VRFIETELSGAFLVELERVSDERGFFARTWCSAEFEARGLIGSLAQCNISYNRRRSTLRGLHFQVAPDEEAKLVHCTRGAIFDVIVDLRPESPTQYRWTSVELSAENHTMLYVPERFAHGFQTLVDDTEVLYQMTAEFRQASGRGLRWDDPFLAISWPIPNPILSARDASHPLLETAR
jgi:dTDP-4-dehydrorhamnose 3,5-epimerase